MIDINNPGNIRHGQPWQGLSPVQANTQFCSFTTSQYGIRAIGKILLTYRADGLTTIRDIIARWAPVGDNNNTTAYVASVVGATGLNADASIDVRQAPVMDALIKAIIRQENGVQPYDDATIEAGVNMALGGA